MARYYGVIGYSDTVETRPGIWEPTIVERTYYGDVQKVSKRNQAGNDKINNDINVNNQISIVADAYAYEHFYAIKYAKWMGTAWTVTDVEVQRPRLILSIGGVYDGPSN